MSDHFERAMQGIALRKKGNGGAVIDDVLTALVATNEDLDEGQIKVLRLLSEHVKEDKARAKAQADVCAANHRKLINEEFTHQHDSDKFADAETHAALVADAAEKAATKAAILVAETAKKAAGVRVHAAEDAATVLTDAASAAPKRFTK